MFWRVLLGAAILVGSIACDSFEALDSPGSREVIKKTYDDWVNATNAKDIDLWSSFVAPEAVFLPPGSPALETREDIVAYYANLFQDPVFELDCAQTFVEIAESGELAWARGVCHVSFTDPSGNPASGDSKWTKVWVRVEDGSWKCRLNTWNYGESS